MTPAAINGEKINLHQWGDQSPTDDIASGGGARFRKVDYLTLFDTKSARNYVEAYLNERRYCYMEYKVAKYFQIKQNIINEIKSGERKPGDKVDSESVLKKKYNVSTITVRKAFTDLINEGYLIGVQGVGTFVTKKPMIRGLTSISFSDELLQQGYEIDMHVDKIEEVLNESIADILEIPQDQSIICVRRVRLANNEPIAYQSSYLDSRMLSFEQAKKIYENGSFYKTLGEYKINPVWVNENYSIKQVNDNGIAKLMNIKKGTDAFFVKRIAFSESDKVIEFAETFFNKDWYSVTVNIKV